jgi:hypothetical protein
MLRRRHCARTRRGACVVVGIEPQPTGCRHGECGALLAEWPLLSLARVSHLHGRHTRHSRMASHFATTPLARSGWTRTPLESQSKELTATRLPSASRRTRPPHARHVTPGQRTSAHHPDARARERVATLLRPCPTSACLQAPLQTRKTPATCVHTMHARARARASARASACACACASPQQQAQSAVTRGPLQAPAAAPVSSPEAL